MLPGTKANRTEYWQYLLLYTDGILAVIEEPEKLLQEEVDKRFTLKEKSISIPTKYVGYKVSKVTMENGKSAESLALHNIPRVLL